MTAPYRSAAELHSALVDARLLVPTDVDGLYQRSGEFEDVVTGVQQYAARQRTDTSAPRRWFAPVLPRTDFLQTDYLRSFPDLVGTVDVFSGGDAEHKKLLAAMESGEDWSHELGPSDLVLSSSVCHSLYGTVSRDVPDAGTTVECCGFAFRHEPSQDPARMQSFRMYEFVHIGTPTTSESHQLAWRDRGREALAALQLPVRTEVAHDPFFGRSGRMLAANQVESTLKFEVLVDITDERPTAIASANYHEDHFGVPFGLRTPDGAFAHSACFGFGLERITLALFATHGLEVSGWPASVRSELGC